MFAVCKVSKDGKLLEIKEVSDDYRNKPYNWDDDQITTTLKKKI